MAFKLGDNINGVRELKLGKSFDKGCKGEAFHTIRYDFKPASVNSQKAGNLNIADKEVTLTVPLVASSGTAQEAVFKGNKTSASKDCLLIIDNKTGEIVLEKISENIRVKKTRTEGSSKKPVQSIASDSNSKKKAAVGHLSGAVATSNGISSQRPSTNSAKAHATGKQSTGPTALGSMPLLGFEDENKTEMKSDSSSDSDSNSDSSSSSSDSDSDSDTQTKFEENSKPIDNAPGRWENSNKNIKRSILSDLELSEED